MKKFITSLAVIATVGLSGCSVPTFTPNGWPGVSQQNASSPSPSPSPTVSETPTEIPQSGESEDSADKFWDSYFPNAWEDRFGYPPGTELTESSRKFAKSLCKMRENGYTHEQVILFLAKHVNSAKEAHQAGFVYGAGVAIYCPEYGE